MSHLCPNDRCAGVERDDVLHGRLRLAVNGDQAGYLDDGVFVCFWEVPLRSAGK